MLGQRSHRDEVDPGRGVSGKGIEGDVAGDFQLGSALIEANGFLHHGDVEVVQHHDVGPCGQGLLQLGQGFDLDFHRFVRIETARFADCFSDAAAGENVVLLDEVSIKQTDAVVFAAAAGDRILLGATQAGQGLAGIEQAAVSTFQLGYITGGQGGDPGKGLPASW